MDGNPEQNRKPEVSLIGNQVIEKIAHEKIVPSYILDRICKLTRQKSCFVATFNEEFTFRDFTATGFSITGYGIQEQLLPVALEFVRAGMLRKLPLNYRTFYIWSMEHRAWWKPNKLGYTLRKDEAGRYSFEEAVAICASANKHSADYPKEAMIAVNND